MANNSTSLCSKCFAQKPTNNPGDIYLWVGFVVVLAIFISNFITLIVMVKNAQIRKHRFFRFLICLSINAILTSPYLFTATVFRKITPMDDFSKLRIYFDCMLLQTYLHHGIIAIERLFATRSNFEFYQKYFTTWRQALYLALSYVIVGAFACVVVGINYNYDETKPLHVYGRKHDFILFIYGCIVLALLATITVVSSVSTYRMIKSHMYWKRVVQPVAQDSLQIPTQIQSLSGVVSQRSKETTSTDKPTASTWVIHVAEENGKLGTVTSARAYEENEAVVLEEISVSRQRALQVNKGRRKNTTATHKRVPLTASKSKRGIEHIKTFLLVLFVVLCLNVPYWFTRVLIYADKELVTPAAYRVTFIITGTQYAMNPIIYFFRIKMFRKALVCTNQR